VAQELLTLTKYGRCYYSANHCSFTRYYAAIAKELIDNSGMPILSAVEFKTADQVKAALS
jgi:hypothetical protein